MAASLFQELCYQNKDGLSAGIIVGGWDKENGGSVWNVPLGGSLHRQPFAIGGSGSTYIYGYCDATYRDGMNQEECIEFVKNCKTFVLMPFCICIRISITRLGRVRDKKLISPLLYLLFDEFSALALAMSRDGSSGGVIRMAIITEKGVERIFVPGDKLPGMMNGGQIAVALLFIVCLS